MVIAPREMMSWIISFITWWELGNPIYPVSPPTLPNLKL